jgi:hypothetical protein
MSRNQAMLLVAIATAVCAAVLLLADTSLLWLRVAAGIPFVLLLPGQAVMLFVDPDGRLGGLEWFTLSASVSISLAILIGMGLAASIGLTASGIIETLTFATVLALTAARAHSDFVPPRPLTLARLNPARRAAFGALALLTGTALVLALAIPDTRTAPADQSVQLWGLPDKSGGLRIGVNNVNAASRNYRLRIEQGGRLISQQELSLPAGSDRQFVILKSATWTNSAPVSAVLTDASGVLKPRNISVWTIE